MTIAVLNQNGFVYVDAWRTIDCKPHKVPWIRHQSGLYAFVIGDEVVYVGMAKVLHSRLRNYSRRAFRDVTRPPRESHSSTAKAIEEGIAVKIYAKVMPDADSEALLAAETAIIQQLHPIWNRTHMVKDDALDL